MRKWATTLPMYIINYVTELYPEYYSKIFPTTKNIVSNLIIKRKKKSTTPALPYNTCNHSEYISVSLHFIRRKKKSICNVYIRLLQGVQEMLNSLTKKVTKINGVKCGRFFLQFFFVCCTYKKNYKKTEFFNI